LIRLFLDANVLFTAAHNPSGKAALVIDLGARGYWEVMSCSYAIEEARRNLSIKFPDSLKRVEAFLEAVTKVPSRSGRNYPINLPEKDRPILEAAIQCKASHLLTGDIKNFSPFMNNSSLAGGVVIQTPSEFLKSLMRSKVKAPPIVAEANSNYRVDKNDIHNRSELQKFEMDFLKREKVDIDRNLRIVEALYKEAVSLGVIPLKNSLDGIEVDLKIAKVINCV